MSSDLKILQKEIVNNVNGENVDDINGNFHLRRDSPTLDTDKPERIIRKAKRFNRQRHPSSETNGVLNGVTHALKNQVATKNSRKSRNGKGRGLPKKGGAGGKGVWGLPGDELFNFKHQDTADPNYDPESEDEYVVAKVDPIVDGTAFEKMVTPLLLEYFDHGDAKEVQVSLSSINFGDMKPMIAETVISLSLDKKASERELTSQLLSELYGQTLQTNDIMAGFNNILQNLSDLTLDAPDAPTLVGQFIARAVADDCLPPKYISSYKGKIECPHIKLALEKADILLSMNHGIVRLDDVWGTGGGTRPVKILIKKMVLLLKEYLSSGDIEEATRCLKELDVPHFHHELVYEAIVMVLEDSSQQAAEMMTALLKSLCEAVQVTPDQMVQGVRRVYDNMPDISLDVPCAYSLLQQVVTMLGTEHIINGPLVNDVPQRGRKRFVSEGDGGRLKPTVK